MIQSILKILFILINQWIKPKKIVTATKTNIKDFASFSNRNPIPTSKHTHVNEFLSTIGVKIMLYCVGTKIFPSMAIAQAALESGWNKNASTLYGIKSIGWKGKSIAIMTKEERDKIVSSEVHSFRAYSSVDASIKDYIKVLYSAPWFKDVVESVSVEEAILNLQDDEQKYATDSNYANSLLRIISSNDLKYFDRAKKYMEG